MNKVHLPIDVHPVFFPLMFVLVFLLIIAFFIKYVWIILCYRGVGE